jgi:hypothetical protein
MEYGWMDYLQFRGEGFIPPLELFTNKENVFRPEVSRNRLNLEIFGIKCAPQFTFR